MITKLDHFVLICPDIEAGVAAYETLLGAAPVWRAEDADGGSASALFKVDNTALELMAPLGEGPVGARLLEMLEETGPRLTSLAYEVADAGMAHHAFGRRGLLPSEIGDGASTDLGTGARRRWKRFRCSDDACGGVKTFILQYTDGLLPDMDARRVGAVSSLDHLVINTPNPDRAVALYGARLGLRFALDRTAEEWKTRFLFFRLGGLTLEVIHRLDGAHERDGPDRVWGLTWTVADLEAARARLGEAGLTVSEIRVGRKPGSRVFTVKDGTLGIPTLFIAHEGA
jgi:catechol 2,3-dioxygenase-like lactoylglutathione lyase family enzyme